MKKLLNRSNVQVLSKEEQKILNGGDCTYCGCCGSTGGHVVDKPQNQCAGYGFKWCNNQCWVCY